MVRNGIYLKKYKSALNQGLRTLRESLYCIRNPGNITTPDLKIRIFSIQILLKK